MVQETQGFGQSNYFSEEKEEIIDTQNELLKFKQKTVFKQIHPSFTFKTGSVYTGEWKGNLRDGKGQQVWTDQAMYNGEWKDDHANGQGKFYHTNGEIYDGAWKNDKANGFGEF